MQLPNTEELRFVMETDEERKARPEKMVETTQLRLALETEQVGVRVHNIYNIFVYNLAN